MVSPFASPVFDLPQYNVPGRMSQCIPRYLYHLLFPPTVAFVLGCTERSHFFLIISLSSTHPTILICAHFTGNRDFSLEGYFSNVFSLHSLVIRRLFRASVREYHSMSRSVGNNLSTGYFSLVIKMRLTIAVDINH